MCGTIAGVIDVHDLHIWSLGSEAHALSCHVLIEDMPPSASESILRCINRFSATVSPFITPPFSSSTPNARWRTLRARKRTALSYNRGSPPKNMLRKFRGIAPTVAASAYVDPSAQVIGDVTVGERSSIWPNASCAATSAPSSSARKPAFRITACFTRTMVSLSPSADRVTVGHSVTLHGCTIEDDSLIGIGSTVLNGARIGKGSVVAAGSLVPENMEVPPVDAGHGRSREAAPRGVRPKNRRASEKAQSTT